MKHEKTRVTPRHSRLSEAKNWLLASPSVATWISLAIRIGGLAVLLPLVLRHFDVHQVLVWQVLSSISAMVLWIDFGFAPTFTRFIAVARGGGTWHDLLKNSDIQKISVATKRVGKLDLGKVLGTQKYIYGRLAIVCVAVTGIVGTLTLLKPLSGLSYPAEGWIAWILTALSALLLLLNGTNVAVLVGFDQITRLRRIESVVGLFQLAASFAIVLFGGHLIALALNTLVFTLLMFSAVKFAGDRAIKAAGVVPRPRDPDFLAVVWPAAWRSGIGILSSAGVIQASGLVMPQLAPAAEAASFLLVLRLITTASQISQAPFYTKLPTMTKANAEGRKDEVIALSERGMNLALWTFTLCIIGLVFVAPFGFKLIGGSVQLPDAKLSIILGFAFFAERYGGMHMQIYTLSNHVIWHIVNGLTGLIMIVSFVVLYPLAGDKAVPLAMLIGYGGFLCWTVSRRSLRFLGISRWKFELATSVYPLLFLIGSVAVYAVLAGN